MPQRQGQAAHHFVFRTLEVLKPPHALEPEPKHRGKAGPTGRPSPARASSNWPKKPVSGRCEQREDGDEDEEQDEDRYMSMRMRMVAACGKDD